MLVEKITSRQNPLVKRLRRVRVGAEHHHIFLEGVRLIEEALKASAHFESVAYTADLETTERGPALLQQLRTVPCLGALVSNQVMQVIADTESPQGVVAIVSRPHYELADLFKVPPQLVVIADGLQDPGNLGTIIRTAEAAGSTGVAVTRNTVDPFNRKALRAAMGSTLRLPVATDVAVGDVLKLCRERKVKLIAAQPKRAGLKSASFLSKAYDRVDLTGPVALILGREASGVSDKVKAAADLFVHIPMARDVDSLNVAAAAAVLLYEAARQRKFKFGRQRPGHP